MKDLLRKGQLKFLKKHNVPIDKLFNAEGMKRQEYSAKMKELNKSVAFNVSPCRNGNHTLRNRSGHCVQCKTAYLAFQKRSDSSGVVYIAKSKKGNVIKIGFSKSVDVRSESLNRTQYAGYSDWKIKFAVKSASAGRIENEVGSELRDYSYSKKYDHDNHSQDAIELFDCGVQLAEKALLKVSKEYLFDIVEIQ